MPCLPALPFLLAAVGGLGAYVFHGSLESLFCGWGGGVWLALCSLAMSDMRTPWLGPFGVKMAFGEWLVCACQDAGGPKGTRGDGGRRHRLGRRTHPRVPNMATCQ